VVTGFLKEVLRQGNASLGVFPFNQTDSPKNTWIEEKA
jgi:hypothetical protein